MIKITMPRGDIRVFRFQVYNTVTDDIADIDFTEIFISVKKSAYNRDVLFQKRLTDGGIEKLGVGDYQFKIDARDTDQLDFNRTYSLDIELVYGNEIKQTEYGQLELTPEVTCIWNEV